MQIAHGLHQQWYEPISLFALTKKEETEILNDLKIPYTLIDVEAFYYDSCSATAIAYATVEIDGTTFTAIPNTLTFADPPTILVVTYEYPSVTITSLTPGEILSFVPLLLQKALISEWYC